ncbi:transporter [bacterium]|nr:MAG: transporter [bacterium]
MTIRWSPFIVLWYLGAGPVMFGQSVPSPKVEYSKGIEDNSFFIEEAYNQEKGVVQHISNLQYSFTRQRDLLYTFTQEWPLGGGDHQLSYTAPISLYSSTHPGGVGDILINYRYQLVDNDGWANVAPRLSVIFPTGSAKSGLGAGTTGLQVNIAASKRLSQMFVTHMNAGFTYLPHMKDESSSSGTIKHTLTSYNAGASVIWLTAETFNLMLEYTTSFSSDVFEDGTNERTTDTIISPGVRWAINLNSLQIVPGVGFPIMLGRGTVRTGVFLYLSFEHPF